MFYPMSIRLLKPITKKDVKPKPPPKPKPKPKPPPKPKQNYKDYADKLNLSKWKKNP